MQVISRPCGLLRTNCYLITDGAAAVAIDPGDGAAAWIAEQNLAIKAVLNTHGHFDHVADNAAIARAHGCAIFCPADDVFMLANPEGFEPSDALATPVAPGTDAPATASSAAVSKITIAGAEEFGEFSFHHCPGHTPGSSVIEWRGHYFTGDFLFANTIGRCDFAYSSPADMLASLRRALGWLEPTHALHPGHGLGCHAGHVMAQIPAFCEWF